MKGFMGRVYEWIQKHSLISAGILFCIVITSVGFIVFGIAKKTANTPTEKDSETTEIASETEVSGDRYTLLKNNDEELVAVVKNYQDALANNDQEVIKKYMDGISENELDNIEVRSQYVESYNSVDCYTQRGEKEGSYYVYIAYMLKMKDFDSYIPGLTGLYFCKDEDGDFHIYRKNEMSEAEQKDFYAAFLQQEVQDLYKNVDMKYNECLDKDESLKTYMSGFEDMVKDEMAKRIVLKEASEQLAVASEAAASEAAASEGAGDGQNTTLTVKATTAVNVRKSDSETADKLGKVSKNTELVCLEQQVNGWSKVMYEGKEGFIKSEYLTVVGQDTVSTGKYVTVKENVNIRKAPSQDADRLALALAGDKLELIEKMSDGWSKIKYNGKEAYVKSEYVE